MQRFMMCTPQCTSDIPIQHTHIYKISSTLPILFNIKQQIRFLCSQFLTHMHTHSVTHIHFNSQIPTYSVTARHRSPVNKQQTLRDNRNAETNIKTSRPNTALPIPKITVFFHYCTSRTWNSTFLSQRPALLNIRFLHQCLRLTSICNSNVLFGSDVPIYFHAEFLILLLLFVSNHNLFIYDKIVFHFIHGNEKRM
jgi:hypothetical protein